MYTRRNIRWRVILRFAWWQLIVFSAWSSIVTLLYLQLKSHDINASLPIAPLGTIGVAVAFYIGFKNNQSYDRYWEARKIWGGIVNVSRSFTNQILSFISKNHSTETVDPKFIEETQRTMVYRHLAWITALRCQLRRKTSFGFSPKGTQKFFAQDVDVEAMRNQLKDFLPEDELKSICSKKNSATQILRHQTEHLQKAIEEHHLTEEFRFISTMDLITEMYTLQGKCERIKTRRSPGNMLISAMFSLGYLLCCCRLVWLEKWPSRAHG